MKNMARNKRSIWYANLINVEVPEGEDIGEYDVIYSTPVQIKMNVSIARGETTSDPFGVSLDYDRLLISDDPNIPIDEYSVLWINSEPKVDSNGIPTTPFNHTVKKVAQSLNSMLIAAKQVKVS